MNCNPFQIGLATAPVLDDIIRDGARRALQDAIERDRKAFNAGCRGKTVAVLFEKPGRLPGQLVGRSPYLQPVQAMAPAELIGQVAMVTITDVGTNSLFGTLSRGPAADATSIAELQHA